MAAILNSANLLRVGAIWCGGYAYSPGRSGGTYPQWPFARVGADPVPLGYSPPLWGSIWGAICKIASNTLWLKG